MSIKKYSALTIFSFLLSLQGVPYASEPIPVSTEYLLSHDNFQDELIGLSQEESDERRTLIHSANICKRTKGALEYLLYLKKPLSRTDISDILSDLREGECQIDLRKYKKIGF